VSEGPFPADLLERALVARSELLSRLASEETDCVRLFHGAVEGLPGVTVDRYGPEVLVQVWRPEALPLDADAIAQVVHRGLGIELPVRVHLRGRAAKTVRSRPSPVPPAEGLEQGLRYDVTPPARGRDPLLFLDLRAGRRAVRAASRGRTVLNLFAYTCGVGVAAAAGGATEVLNVDFAGSALAVGRMNAERNGLGEPFETLLEDVIPVIRQLSGLGVRGRGGRRRRFTRLKPRRFDVVVLDPPRWAKSPFGAVDLVRDYPSVFKPALLSVAEGGALLVTNNVASVDLDAWLDVLRRCAHKAGRPLESVDVIAPDSDFPSPDGRHPLKMAWIRV
jgi:23S rRNA (cytosine1962-C5)-methyltransferase